MEVIANDIAILFWNGSFKGQHHYTYSIKCTENNKTYVGRTVSLRNRLRQHRNALKIGTHQNKGLQEDYNRFGADSFVFKIETVSRYRTDSEEEYMRKYRSYDPRYGYNNDALAKKLRRVLPSRE